MIDPVIFHKRRGTCEACHNWKGVCLKGHSLASPVGCPEHKFEPVEGASFMEDRPAVVLSQPVAGPCCGGAVQADVKEMTYAEAVKGLAQSMREWRAAGYPVTTDAEYQARTSICKSGVCGAYKWFQCRLCKCVIIVKAKLRTTGCPKDLWPKL